MNNSEREEALRLARGWEAKPLPTEKITPEGIGVVARALLALAADLEAAEEKIEEIGQAAVRESRRCDDFRRRWEEREREWALEHDRAEAAERERDALLRQRVELQNSIGGYVTQVDKLCEQRAQAWRDLDFWMTDAKNCAVAHDKLADDLATAREALELLRFSPNEECWCSARSIDVPEFHTATCERVRELLKNV